MSQGIDGKIEDKADHTVWRGRQLWRKQIGRLKNSTFLSNQRMMPILPMGIMQKIRDAVYPGAIISTVRNASNPYIAAKERLNDLWSRQHKKFDSNEPIKESYGDANKLEKLATLRGAMAAFWTGEELKKSLLPTVGLASVISMSGYSTMMMLNAYAETLSALINGRSILTGSAKFLAYGAVNYVGNKGVMRLRDNLQEDMAFWLRNQFIDSVAEEPEIMSRLREQDIDDDTVHMDRSSPLHALGKSPEDFAENLIGFGVQGYASLSTALFMIYGIAQNSALVPILGNHGTLYLSILTVGAYSTFTYKVGAKLGQDAALSLEEKKKVESYNEKALAKLFDRDSIVDPAHCADVLQQHNKKIKASTINNNVKDRRYANFMNATGLGGFFVTPLSALASLPWGTGNVLSAMAQQSFFATHAQTQFLHGTITQGVNLFASRGRVTVPAKVISEMAQEFIEAKGKVQKDKLSTEGEEVTRSKKTTLSSAQTNTPL